MITFCNKRSMKRFYLMRNGMLFKVPQGKVRIGRHNKNNIVVDDIKVGRFHAVLFNTGEYLWLNARKSVNGTFDKNGKKIVSGELIRLDHNDMFGVGCPPCEDRFCTFTVHVRSELDFKIVENLTESDMELINKREQSLLKIRPENTCDSSVTPETVDDYACRNSNDVVSSDAQQQSKSVSSKVVLKTKNINEGRETEQRRCDSSVTPEKGDDYGCRNSNDVVSSDAHQQSKSVSSKVVRKTKTINERSETDKRRLSSKQQRPVVGVVAKDTRMDRSEETIDDDQPPLIDLTSLSVSAAFTRPTTTTRVTSNFNNHERDNCHDYNLSPPLSPIAKSANLKSTGFYDSFSLPAVMDEDCNPIKNEDTVTPQSQSLIFEKDDEGDVICLDSDDDDDSISSQIVQNRISKLKKENTINIFSSPDALMCLDSDDEELVESLSRQHSESFSQQQSSQSLQNCSFLADVKDTDEAQVYDVIDDDVIDDDVKWCKSLIHLEILKEIKIEPVDDDDEITSQKNRTESGETLSRVKNENLPLQANYQPQHSTVTTIHPNITVEPMRVEKPDDKFSADSFIITTTATITTTVDTTSVVSFNVPSVSITAGVENYNAGEDMIGALVNTLDNKCYKRSRSDVIPMIESTASKKFKHLNYFPKGQIQQNLMDDCSSTSSLSGVKKLNTDCVSEIKTSLKKSTNTQTTMLNKRNRHLSFISDPVVFSVLRKDMSDESPEDIPRKKITFLWNLGIKFKAAFDTALVVICKWNVMWLQEQLVHYPTKPPLYPDISSGKYGEYSNSQLYTEKLRYLLYHDMWNMIARDWESRYNAIPETQLMTSINKNYVKHVIVQSVFKGSTYVPKSGKDWFNSKLCIIHAYRVLTYESEQTDIIERGHLITLNVKKSADQSSLMKIRTLLFGYISHDYKIYVKKGIDLSGYNLKTCEGKPFVIQRIDIITAERSFEILPNSVMKIVVLSPVNAFLRSLSALAFVTYTPVMDAIVLPQVYDYYVENKFRINRRLETKKLSEDQRKALNICLNLYFSSKPNLCLIDGAAGTGKTTVIINLLIQIFDVIKYSPDDEKKRILIATKHDYEADDLVYHLDILKRILPAEKTCNIVRYGNKPTNAYVENYYFHNLVELLVNSDAKNMQVSDEENIIRAKLNSAKHVLDSSGYADSVKRHIKGDKLDGLMEQARRNIRKYEGILSELANSNTSDYVKEGRKLLARIHVLEKADVLVTTFSSCFTSEAEDHFVPNNLNRGDITRIDTCIFDDCSSHSEIDCLIPIMFRTRRVIMVGDRNQTKDMPEMTVFGRLLNYENHHPNSINVVNLDVQFRSDPEIFHWPQRYYYHSMRQNACENKYWNLISPYLILWHNYPKDYDGETNEDESDLIISLVNCIAMCKKLPFSKLTIAVITANQNQLDVVRSALNRSKIPNKHNISVITADDITGRQYDIVLLSLVESPHPSKEPTFLNRILTRAITSLIICGNFHDHEENIAFTKMLDDARIRGVLHSITSPPNQIAKDKLKNIILKFKI